MSERVTDLVKDIRTNLKQRSASQKDEVKVMRAMLNDKDFRVGEYTKEGKVGEYSPYEDSRKMVSTILSSAAKIPSAEAKEIANKYEFSKAEAVTMINLSKEFVNTYVHTGRKLPLGGREKSDCKLIIKENKDAQKKYDDILNVDLETGLWNKKEFLYRINVGSNYSKINIYTLTTNNY